ncbi:sensor histidine kinase [Ktedonobacter racemifer]|uniref:sensor histidine kinase n=1 Tax=Ktedonobacter racemifer TaxID=363277 RepID=UPI000590998A|nr:HAMP domain-containing protein [Ktedonobacter racemifer]
MNLARILRSWRGFRRFPTRNCGYGGYFSTPSVNALMKYRCKNRKRGFAIGAVCTTLLVFFFLSRWIITPFQHMIVAMMQVQEGNLHTRFVTDGEDEIAQLGNAFNTMVARLNTLIEREYVATLNQRNAEYHALQAQVQPHFLYRERSEKAPVIDACHLYTNMKVCRRSSE